MAIWKSHVKRYGTNAYAASSVALIEKITSKMYLQISKSYAKHKVKYYFWMSDNSKTEY